MGVDQELESKILAAAVMEFEENGFQASSMRSVAARAGIAVGTIYNYVDNKEDLFRRVLEQSWQELYGETARLLATSDSLAVKLRRFGQLQLEFVSHHRKVWLEMMEPSGGFHANEDDQSFRNKAFEQYVGLLVDILAAARIRGEIRIKLGQSGQRGRGGEMSDLVLANMFIAMVNSLNQTAYHAHLGVGGHSGSNLSSEPSHVKSLVVLETTLVQVESVVEVFLNGVIPYQPIML